MPWMWVWWFEFLLCMTLNFAFHQWLHNTALELLVLYACLRVLCVCHMFDMPHFVGFCGFEFAMRDSQFRLMSSQIALWHDSISDYGFHMSWTLYSAHYLSKYIFCRAGLSPIRCLKARYMTLLYTHGRYPLDTLPSWADIAPVRCLKARYMAL